MVTVTLYYVRDRSCAYSDGSSIHSGSGIGGGDGDDSGGSGGSGGGIHATHDGDACLIELD